ncbi:methyltransferase [Yoonia sp. 2307UL14-13]|uniref:methyltransferase n=1 Tax=Yoonia sp. 2307UL14-13 TaxID=3126506 RepID=UPI0030B43D43
MADLDLPGAGLHPPAIPRKSSWLIRLVASRRFQSWAARFPLTRRIVRHEGEAMFDLVAGFCHSQILQALVKLEIFDALLKAEHPTPTLARIARVPDDRMRALLCGGAALGLLHKRRNGNYALTTRGAALATVPGLKGMIAHHDVLYRDLADPVAFFRGEVETELAAFWPYVFGAGAADDPQQAATYSELMADSQTLVAEDTLAAISLDGVRHLMDVGGGSGAFLCAAAARHPQLRLSLFDLPAVAPAAQARFESAGLDDRTTIHPGSFRDDPLPKGPDMICLVRVLYDHSDDTVGALLRAVYAALPKGGRILISEPMTGGARPTRPGDAYFALYCMAMRTGQARAPADISALMAQAGFARIGRQRTARPFVTSVITGVRLD